MIGHGSGPGGRGRRLSLFRNFSDALKQIIKMKNVIMSTKRVEKVMVVYGLEATVDEYVERSEARDTTIIPIFNEDGNLRHFSTMFSYLCSVCMHAIELLLLPYLYTHLNN